VLASDTKSVLLGIRFWNDVVTPLRYSYLFWLLTIVPDRYDPNPEMAQYTYDDHRLNDAAWSEPAAYMLDLYFTSRHCNPRLNGSSANYPWYYGSYGRFTFHGRIE